MVGKTKLNKYKEAIDKGNREIIEFVVKNNLNSQLKIASIELKEIGVTGEVKKRTLAVVEDMFIEKEEEQPIKKEEEVKSPERIAVEKKIMEINAEEAIVKEKVIVEEIPVAIVENEMPTIVVQKSLNSSHEQTKELLTGLQNNRNEKPKKGFFGRLAKSISGNV